MKTTDALQVLSINEVEITLEAVKKAFHGAAKKYHPDVNPAGLEMMKMVNEAYESLLKEDFPITNSEENPRSNYGEEFNEALNKIIHFSGIEIEICGSWAWVSGNTKEHKEHFKGAGFKWSPKKIMWYFRPEGKARRFFNKSYSMDEIRNNYGSRKVYRPSQHLIRA